MPTDLSDVPCCRMFGIGHCKLSLAPQQLERHARHRKMLNDLIHFKDPFPEDKPPGALCSRPFVFAFSPREEPAVGPLLVLVKLAWFKLPELPVWIRVDEPDVTPGAKIPMPAADTIIQSIEWNSSLPMMLANRAAFWDVEFVRCRWFDISQLEVLGRVRVAPRLPLRPDQGDNDLRFYP